MKYLRWIAGAGMLLSGLAAAEQPALVTDDFERGLNGWRPHGSQPAAAAERAAVLTVVPGEKPGTHAMKLVDRWNDSNPYAMRFIKDVRPPQGDEQAKFTFRACYPAGKRFQVKTELGIPDPARPGRFRMFSGESYTFTGTGKWENYSWTFTRLPNKPYQLGIGFIAYVYSRDFTLQGELLVDNVQITYAVPDLRTRYGIDREPGNMRDYPYTPAEGEVRLTNPGSFAFTCAPDWKPGKYTYTVEYSQDPAFPKGKTGRITGLDMHMVIPQQTLAPGKWFWRYGLERSGKTPVWSRVRSFTMPANVPKMPFPDIRDVIARIPKGHPRIYFTPESAREFMRRGTQGDLKKTAEKRMEFQRRKWLGNLQIPDGEPPMTPRWGTVSNEKRGEVWRKVIGITHWRLAHMESLAMTYRMTGNKDFGLAAKEYVKYFFHLDPDGATSIIVNDEPGMWIMRRGILSYDWTYDLFTPAERKEVTANLKMRARRIYEYLRSHNFDAHPYGSHQTNGYQQILLEASIFLAPEDPDPAIREWMRYSLTTFWTCWPVFGTPDGGWSEGPAYWSWSIDRGLRMTHILRTATGIDLSEKPFIKNTGYYLLHGWPGRSKLYSGCDSFAPESQASSLYSLAMVLGNPDFLAPSQELKMNFDVWVSVLQCIKPPESLGRPRLDKLPPARLFPDIGFVAMRNTLSNYDNDIGMLFQSCPFGNFSHRLSSQNNIQFEAYTERLFFSGGHYDGQGSPHYNDWTVQSRSHNCMTYDDGKGQPRGGQAQGKITHFADKKVLAVATGDASAAYPELKSVKRTVVHLRPDVFLIRDRITAAAPHVYEFNLHTDKETPFTETPDGITIRKPKAGCRVVLLASAPWKLKTWTGFRVQPLDPKKYPDRRHFRFSSAKDTGCDLITVFLPFRAGQDGKLPQVTRSGETVTLTWPDGKVRKVQFQGDSAVEVK